MIKLCAGKSGKLFACGEGIATRMPGKLSVRSCQTGKVCAEFKYHEPMNPTWFDTGRGIVLASSEGELIRWELPADLKCD
jgi:hypothetical protein